MLATHNPKLNVMLRRGPVPDDRKPRRVLPGDYYAIILDNLDRSSMGYYAISSVFDHSMAPASCFIGWEYHLHSKPARPEEVPPELLAYLRYNGPGEPEDELVFRRRMSHRR